MNRIHRLVILFLVTAVGSLLAQTGAPVPELQMFDSRVAGLLDKWKVPGAALAITNNGRLVFAHGYGLANLDTGEPVQPDSLFRIASVSKPFTATGIMKLVEEGKLDPDAKVYSILRDLMPPQGQLIDERLRDITVRDLLRHSGGWDDHALDPLKYALLPVAAANYFGVPSPPSARMLIRYAYSNVPLDNTPGTKYAYSNFGYTLLGRVIEEISGIRYEEFIRREILNPAGIQRMAISGNSPGTALPGEVRYYDYPDAPLAPTIFAEGPNMLPAPYDMENRMMDAFGGWAASAIDLVRFSEAFDGRRGTALLKPETIQTMVVHDWNLWPGRDVWQGLGWVVQPAGGGFILSHNGEHRGDRSLLLHWPGGLSVAMVFNSCPLRSDDFITDVGSTLAATLAQVRTWPANDLFSQYDSAPLSALSRASGHIR